MSCPRWLAGGLSLGLMIGTTGCGGSSSAPQSAAPKQNQAPGAAGVVGVDMGMMNGAGTATPSGGHGAGMGATSDVAPAEYTPPADSAEAMANATGLQETPGAVAPGAQLTDPAQMLAGAGGATIPAGEANYTPPGDGLAGGTGTGIPGQPTTPGGEGGGGQPGQSAQKGSAEFAVVTFFAMTQSGNYSASEDIISPKAKGLAGSVRMGDLPDERVDEYKAAFANPQFLSTKNTGTGIQVVYATQPGETATFLLAKEGTKYVIKELKLTSSKGR